MRIYGVDFTCAPRKAKPITVASGILKNHALQVEALELLESFPAFEAFLDRPDPALLDANRALARRHFSLDALAGQLAGLRPVYRFERLSGRYGDPKQELTDARSVHDLRGGWDFWEFRQRWLADLPLAVNHAMAATDGARLVYSTYLGGVGADEGRDVALDAAAQAYLTGVTDSLNFPTANPLEGTLGAPPNADAFLAKLAPSGDSLVYSTYLGAKGGGGVAVDAERVTRAGIAAGAGDMWPRVTPGSAEATTTSMVSREATFTMRGTLMMTSLSGSCALTPR